MNVRSAWPLLKRTYADWSEDKVPRLGAALAFYTVLSLAPLLLIVIAIAGAVFGEDAVRGELVGQIDQLVGRQGAEAIQEMLANAQKPGRGLVASIVGFVTLLVGATGVFGQLQDAMNTIWEVQPRPGRGLWGMIRERFLSFTMILAIAFLLLVSLVVSTALSALGKFLAGALPFAVLMQAINLVISYGVVVVLFALIFKWLPDVKIAWSDVWIGAALTGLLFVIGKFALGMYLGRASVAGAYGAAGSFVVLLLWIYYSSQIVFFGAEFTQVYANAYGSRIKPAENAERVTEEDRAEQGLPRKGGGWGAQVPDAAPGRG